MPTTEQEIIAALNLRIDDLCQTIQRLSQEVIQLKEQLEKADELSWKNEAEYTALEVENDKLKKQVEELEEYKFMYEELCQ